MPFSLLSTLIMASSIRQTVQKYYQILGILPDSRSKRNFSINFLNLIPINVFLTGCTSAFAFLLLEANTILEFGGAFFVFISQLCSLYILFIQMWKMPNTLKLITNFEKFIEKSRYHAAYNTQNIFFKLMNNFQQYSMKSVLTGPLHSIYDELNVKIEKMCNLTYIVFVYGSLLGFLLPALFATLVNYFVFDLKKDSYILPVPAMYIHSNT